MLKNLSKSQQAVQAGHALAEYFMTFGCPIGWDNGTLIYLKATTKELQQMSGGVSAVWHEPDMNHELTAVALLGPESDPRFIDFRLV